MRIQDAYSSCYWQRGCRDNVLNWPLYHEEKWEVLVLPVRQATLPQIAYSNLSQILHVVWFRCHYSMESSRVPLRHILHLSMQIPAQGNRLGWSLNVPCGRLTGAPAELFMVRDELHAYRDFSTGSGARVYSLYYICSISRNPQLNLIYVQWRFADRSLSVLPRQLKSMIKDDELERERGFESSKDFRNLLFGSILQASFRITFIATNKPPSYWRLDQSSCDAQYEILNFCTTVTLCLAPRLTLFKSLPSIKYTTCMLPELPEVFFLCYPHLELHQWWDLVCFKLRSYTAMHHVF